MRGAFGRRQGIKQRALGRYVRLDRLYQGQQDIGGDGSRYRISQAVSSGADGVDLPGVATGRPLQGSIFDIAQILEWIPGTQANPWT